MAKLQGYFLRYKSNSMDALLNVSDLFPSPISSSLSPFNHILHVSNDASADNRNSSNHQSTEHISSSSSSASVLTQQEQQGVGMKKATSRTNRTPRTLTAEEVDKMVFNPQPGWDKDIKVL